MKPGVDYIGVGCGALIVNDRNETLLLKRVGDRVDSGVWAKSGGKVEFGETVQDAIKREVREELGVEIELLDYLGFTDQINPPGSPGVHWVAISYLARIISGEPKNMEPDKHEEMKWFPLDALPENTSKTTTEPALIYLSGIK
jgi:ADP-ribose pyrophosphatase